MNPETTPSSEGKTWTLGATLLGAATASARADATTVNSLIAAIQSTDETVRGAAWQGAAPLGAPAVQPLAELMSHSDFEIARAAKRALWKIVRHAGRPKANQERKAVQAELVSLLESAPLPVRREVIWMLSEIGDASVVKSVAAWLQKPEACEDARCALERIPGSSATRELEKALKTSPDKCRPALAHSLRVRGRKVEGYPSQKLEPAKPTSVTPK